MIWLDNFKKRLANNMAYSNISEPVLLDTWALKPNIYDNDKLYHRYVTDEDDLTLEHYYIASDFKAHKYTIIDEIFEKLYETASLVTIPEHLTEYHCNYHLVFLDATEDYVLNYYPKNRLSHSTNHYEPLQKAMQCVAFVNDNGRYFLALPMAMPASEFKKVPYIPVINTDLATVDQILKTMPLYHHDSIYACYACCISNNNNLDVRSGYSMCYLADLLASDMIDVLTDYFDKNLRLELDDEGLPKLSLVKTNNFWRNNLSKFTMRDLKTLSQKDPMFKIMNPKDSLFADNHMILLQNNIINKIEELGFISDAKCTNDQQVELLNDNTAEIYHPLVKAKGLNFVLSSMQDKTLQFYTYQNELLYASHGEVRSCSL